METGYISHYLVFISLLLISMTMFSADILKVLITCLPFLQME